MVSTNEDTVKSWIVRISLTITFIIIICIAFKNHIGQKQAKSLSLPSKLKLSSSVTFIVCSLCIMIQMCRKIPFICKYTLPLVFPSSILYPHIFLSFYQLSSLQLAFSMNKQSITKSIAYPIWLFNVLYITGIILAIVTITYTWFTMTIIELPYNLGCKFESKLPWTVLTVACIAFYIIWDWMIVGLYIFKLYQLKKDIRGGNNSKANEIIQKISMILNKILFLTVISEIIGLLFGIPSILRSGMFIAGIGYCIDNIAIVMALYLMLEHNADDYLKLLTLMAKCGCLKCCCCCFGDLGSKMELTKQM